MNIFLIGFMGSGKSTVGKKLANKLGYTFLDMDREIESAQKKSIAHLFKEKGEVYFRDLETSWIENLQTTDTVISTGGGTPCFNNNMTLMKSKGKTIFLSVNSGTLAQRLFKPDQTRPLLANYVQSQEHLERYIDEKLNERLPVYNQCDIIIDAVGFDASKITELVHKIQSNC